jgi:hypothetical protein
VTGRLGDFCGRERLVYERSIFLSGSQRDNFIMVLARTFSDVGPFVGRGELEKLALKPAWPHLQPSCAKKNKRLTLFGIIMEFGCDSYGLADS